MMRIEALDRGLHYAIDQSGRNLSRTARERFSMIDRAHDMLGGFHHIAVLFAIRRCKSLKNALESGTSVVILGRKIGPAEKWPAIGSQKSRERPAALSAHCLNRRLISAINVGPLVAVNLHCDVIVVNELRDLGIFVRLTIHHVAPVAPNGANVKQHRLVLTLSLVEGVRAPLVPLDRLMHRGPQI